MGSGGAGREQDRTLGAVQAGSPFPSPVLAPCPSTHRGSLPGVGGGRRAGLCEAGVHRGVVGVPGQGRAGAHSMAGEYRPGQGPRGGLQSRAGSGGLHKGGDQEGPLHPRSSCVYFQQCPQLPPWAQQCLLGVLQDVWLPCPTCPSGSGGSPGRWRDRVWVGAGGGSWPGCSRWTRTRGW